MGDSAKVDAVAGWRKNVHDIQQEIQFIEEEERQLHVEIKRLEKMNLQEKEAVRLNKLKLAKRIEETERVGKDLDAHCEKQSVAKAAVEVVYQQALDEYDRLHDVVKKVKAKEKECDSRPDITKMLQEESCAWASEEHQLRTAIHALQSKISEAKRQNNDEINVAEARLRDVESQLHSDRMSRQQPHRTQFCPPYTRVQTTSRQTSERGNSFTSGHDAPHVNHPASILLNKSNSRKRDLLGDVTNH